MIEPIMKELHEHMEKTLATLQKELAGVRTGRASAGILDHVRVDYYGTPTPITQMAQVAVPDARMITIQPWDKSSLSTIEKAIQTSDLGLNPQNDGNVIRLVLPELSGDRRKELAKHVKKLAEDVRVAVRSNRRHANDKLKKLEKDKQITADELHAAEARVE
ncbi:MAG: ribosome recycling factor, partial [Candidatus Methylomirabilis sp.]|nr:ribosome recycling factor [Deltaproteobacteria bacterium]